MNKLILFYIFSHLKTLLVKIYFIFSKIYLAIPNLRNLILCLNLKIRILSLNSKNSIASTIGHP